MRKKSVIERMQNVGEARAFSHGFCRAEWLHGVDGLPQSVRGTEWERYLAIVDKAIELAEEEKEND